MKGLNDKYLKPVLIAFVVYVCVLFFWGAVVEKSLLDVKVVAFFFGVYILGIVVIVVILKLYYLLWNYINLGFSRSKGKYGREIPDIHPATASVINNAGVYSIKRIMSSSLLRLVCLDVISIEKHEGNATFSLKKTGRAKDSLTEIDERVLDFALDYCGPSSGGKYKLGKKHTSLFDSFSRKSGEEKDKDSVLKRRVRNIAKAINRDLEKYENLGGVFFPMFVVIPLLCVAPAAPMILLALFFEHSSSSLSNEVSGFVLISLQAFFFFHMAMLLFISGAVFMGGFMNRHITLSRKGIAIWNELRPLKRWLEDYTLLEEKDALSVEEWEEYMVYAAALGVPPRTYKNFIQVSEVANEAVYSDFEQFFDN